MDEIKLNPEIYTNNMAALNNRYPDLALTLSLVPIEKYRLCQQDGCLPNILFPNGTFYYIGNMMKYCEEQFKGFSLENVKIPIFCGMGLGYEIMFWLQFKSQEHQTQAVIIIEKDLELFQCAMNVVDLTAIINNPQIHLFIGVPLDQIYTQMRNHYQGHMQELLMCGVTHPVFLYPSMKVGKDYYIQAIQILFEALFHTIQNYGNCPEDSLIGLENMLDNVAEIVNNPGINLLYDKFKGKPAVIVATGPSLKKNMHLLKGLEDKALIISVDASFKFLIANGIKPHMVTSLEREHAVEQFFDKFDPEEVKDVYMTACPVLFNHVYQSYTGPKIIVYRNFDHFKWLEIDRGIMDIKLSSSNMAFEIAEALGCDPIILVGQDLAYGDNGETHVTEVPFSSEGEGIFFVKGNVAEKVKTNSGWHNFLRAYEVDVDQHRGAVINCTEGGAYIPGTQIANFDETIEKYIQESFGPLEIIKDNLAQFNSVNDDLEKLRGIIEKTETDVRAIIDHCIQAVEICKKHQAELESGPSMERLTEIRQEIIAPRIGIQTAYSDTFQRFLMHVIQATHLKFEMEVTMMHTDPTQILLQFVGWYAFIGDISEICLQSLVKAKEKLYAD
ncbi:MAG: 6-hydroxymethylpterin diphosphokinase MptE-like protein [Sediminibacterium sp.]